MSLLRLNIDQRMAEIGVRSTPARLNINLPKPRMSIHTETSKLQVDSAAPSFRVNRQKINNESGMQSPLEFAKAFRNKGRSAALRGAGQNKDDGNFLANYKIPGDKIPRLAKNKAMSRLQQPDINIGLMPQSSPEVTWDKGHMRINWSKHSVVVDWDGDYMPQLTLEPKYSVEVFMRTEPYFRITVEELIDSSPRGRYVDSAV